LNFTLEKRSESLSFWRKGEGRKAAGFGQMKEGGRRGGINGFPPKGEKIHL